MRQAGNDAVITAEYRLLNALIKDETFRSDSRVHGDLFIHETARSIYDAINHLDKEDIHVTEASLFQAANELDYTVTMPIITAVHAIDSEGATVLEDILSALELARQRKQISEKLEELSKVTTATGPLDQEKLLQEMAGIEQVLKSGSRVSLLKDFDKWSSEYIVDLKERAKGKRYPYGDEHLDKYILKGAYPGAITTIAAGTGQGKSTYVLNLINTLINTYVPCMYISLEMSGIDTYDRLIALRRSIPMSELYAVENIPSVISAVEEEKKSLEDNKRFYLIEEPMLSIARLRSLIKEFKQRSRSDYCVVAIDLVTQLTDFMSSKGNTSVASSMELAMNELNALAKEQNVHFIAVVQFNRDADNFKIASIEDLEILRPSLGNIKNSAAIGERSRVVISLFRKKYYSDRYLIGVEGADLISDIMDVQILKNSSGPAGGVLKYAFVGEFFRCTPLLEDEVTALQAAAELDIEY